MPARHYVDKVRILRVDTDPGDGLGLLQTHFVPGLTRVGRLVDTVALHDIAAQLCFASADVDDVGVRLRDRNRSNRRTGELAIGYRVPACAAVGCLPQPTADGAEVVFIRPAR